MDALTQVLRAVRIKQADYRRIEVTAPWGAAVIPWDFPLLYVVLRGSCFMRVDGATSELELRAGDLAVIAAGRSHTFRDGPATRALPFPDLLDRFPYRPDGTLSFGGHGDQCVLLVAEFRFERPDSDSVLAALPPVMQVTADPAALGARGAVELIAAELVAPDVGSAAIIGRLSDVLFIHALRSHVQQSGAEAAGWIRALDDRLLAPALVAMHRAPERPWTIGTLAREAALSRSAFAARFTDVVGEPPMRYLTRLRMHRAAQLLRGGRASVKEAAALIGYETEASFSKAFHRWYGTRPGAYRTRMLDVADGATQAHLAAGATG